MNGDNCTEESDWTPENVHKLFSQMIDNIPVNVLTCSYSRGLKHVDWDKVAFPPFSAEACRQKWKQHLDKMRKVRSLGELIVEAEGVLSNPFVSPESHPDFPKRPPCPAAMFCAKKWSEVKEEHPEIATSRDAVGAMSKLYCKLPRKKKAKYSKEFQLAYQEYRERTKEFRLKLDVRLSKKKAKAVASKEIGLPPKPPANGYMLFCKEHPTTLPALPGGSNVKNWAQGWRNSTEREKKEYNERANAMKREYTVKLMEHLATLEEKEQQRVLESNAMYISKEVLMRGTLEEPEMLPDLPEEVGYNRAQRKGALRVYSVNLQRWFKTLTTEEQEEYRRSNPGKCKYLKLPQTQCVREDVCPNQPSDSEDEVLEDGNSEEEEQDYPDWNEEVDVNETEEGDITFDMY